MKHLKYILKHLKSIKQISGRCVYFSHMSVCNLINQTVTGDYKVHRYGYSVFIADYFVECWCAVLSYLCFPKSVRGHS